MIGPDYENAHTRIEHLPGRMTKHALTVGGYLVAVTAEVDLRDGWPDYTPRYRPIEIGVTNWDEAALFGRFEIGQLYGCITGGIVFREPLPNVNSAEPYVLKFSDDIPPLRVCTVNCWPTTGP